MAGQDDPLSISNLFGVKGRVAVITGGGSGLGEINTDQVRRFFSWAVMARAWVVNGGHAIIASRKEQALSKVCKELNALGTGKAEYVIGDVSSKAGCVALCEEIKKKVSKIHVLVNNSGVSWGAPYDNVPEKGLGQGSWHECKIDILHDIGADDITGERCNQLGSVKSSLFYSRFQPSGIPGESSLSHPLPDLPVGPNRPVSGRMGMDFGHVCRKTLDRPPSKAAAISLSNNLAVTLAPKYITVNAICPGTAYFFSSYYKGVYPSRMTAYGLKKQADVLNSQHPMGRIGTPEDMAGVFLLLATRAGAHISANYIVTDGGSLASTCGYTKL
ncbi:hypothetical protein VP01_964g1 [Puccinia sorghi]|uniref:Gluconate 5-dehydrogenase n=1 Tax=Puccinia sorghi TaxID=27349 RepID=A0A0L6U642_9BASI|nr:hypothetical protein VP01_964g1 [Puccinia sorghi]